MRRRSRRAFLIAASAVLALPIAARAQTAPRVYRVGVLSSGGTEEDFGTIPEELRKLGVEKGRDYVLDFRSWNRDRRKLGGEASALAAAKPDVIVAFLPPEILAARRATSTIPIVMIYGMMPKELGLIESLARPGGNVTGTLLGTPEGAAKLFQIVGEVLPAQARIAMLYQPIFEGLEPYMLESEQSARKAGLRPTRWPVTTDDELDAALTRLAKEPPNALFVVPTGAIGRQAKRVLQFASAQRIPAIASTRWLVEEESALLTYEADLNAINVRTAAIIAKILKGANPAEIPVEVPSRYDLWINLKTAKTLGIRIPQSVLLQATRLIE